MLRQFERNVLSVQLSQDTKNIISKFEILKKDINSAEKNEVINDVTSAIN